MARIVDKALICPVLPVAPMALAVHHPGMISLFAVALVLQPVAAAASAVQPGAWDVSSKVVDLTLPGVPGFLIRMARGKTKAERKQLAAGQGVEALLAPDPKAQCRIESQSVADGRYAQTLACPQKKGTPVRIVRTGSYDATGFAGQAIVTGTTPKGALRIILEQRASRVGG
ncbi:MULTISPECIES: DUF3617 domain-containing protein [Sphingomonas]|uniref:DUF3617 family protein n=2 Tax=Sphingomonas TaxID=13687 RepID=A0ABU8H208_9SPHN|nr:DUF3617 family protein [Sphingomonas sp. CV7422]